ncbi:MAG: hypothetical protein ABEI53_00640 [Candidatus Magasanikbacteria bacterium]
MTQNQKSKNLDKKIKKTVVETIHEVINDSEYGNKLQEWVEERLSKYKEVEDFSQFDSLKN